MTKKFPFLSIAGLCLFLAACSSAVDSSEVLSEATPDSGVILPTPSISAATPLPTNLEVPEFDIVTLLPRDAIPAIDNPTFYAAAEADREYAPDEQVLGVVFDGEARAYSTGLLSSHEIVNDTVGGRKIAVTW